MKNRIITVAATTAMLIGTIQAAQATDVKIAAAKQSDSGLIGPKQLNDVASSVLGVFDSSKWYDGAGHIKPGEMIDFDPVDPKSWAKIVDPKTHSRVHMTITNPQFYAKFMTPAYYVKFMQPKTWLSYADPATYQPLLNVVSDPKTASYWMQPGAYMHGLSPKAYTQMVNPDAYVKLATKVAEGYGTQNTDTAANMFNPFSWMKQFADATTSITSLDVKKSQ